MADLNKSWEKIVLDNAPERDLEPDLDRVFSSRSYVQNIRYSPLMASARLEIDGGLDVCITAADPDRPESFDLLFYDAAYEENPVYGATVLSYEELQGAVDGFVQGRTAVLGRRLDGDSGENKAGLRALRMAVGLTAAMVAGAALYEGCSDNGENAPQDHASDQNGVVPLVSPTVDDMFGLD